MKVVYDSNNSGGRWWLTDDDWKNLEAAGWKVEWKRKGDKFVREDGRYLGALAVSAERDGLTMREAIEEFERVSGQDSAALGCFTCCGPPHSFSFTGDNGEHEYYSPDAPTTGSRY